MRACLGQHRAPRRFEPFLTTSYWTECLSGKTPSQRRTQPAEKHALPADVRAEQAPDQHARLPYPVLDVVAAVRPVARCRHVDMIERSLGGEPLDFVPVQVIEAVRADAVEQRRLGRASRPARSDGRTAGGRCGTLGGGHAGRKGGPDGRTCRCSGTLHSVGEGGHWHRPSGPDPDARACVHGQLRDGGKLSGDSLERDARGQDQRGDRQAQSSQGDRDRFVRRHECARSGALATRNPGGSREGRAEHPARHGHLPGPGPAASH